ncbi:MAG: 2-dehydro-3-deoxyphosphooctonate aldolase [Owenweeksia sp. TMED14]|nr:MAG: 2-dehydro-3-deoxyphosphooctonate aldolase [Owenweeksia sp. TMED14]
MKKTIIIGPCVMESQSILDEVGSFVSEIALKYLEFDFVFKSSFDKANRTSYNSFRGPGLEKGMLWMSDLKLKYDLKVTSDIHEGYQASPAGEVLDIIQIPAFLCRQTDILKAACETGKHVNVKKGQFLSGKDMKNVAQKLENYGATSFGMIERGNVFGYNNLVVDFTNILEMKKFSNQVIMDCTHSVQKPGGLGEKSGGNREYVSYMANAAKAFDVDGYFFEIHPDPDNALSDGPNMVKLENVEEIIKSLL